MELLFVTVALPAEAVDYGSDLRRELELRLSSDEQQGTVMLSFGNVSTLEEEPA